MKSPIFLFSLPRSGSTLLQRVLMSHDEIASVAEPWLLLPFFYAAKREGVLTEYAHRTAHVAFNDFINNLPQKEDSYYNALRDFATSLYQEQCLKQERYFLDKTPRYYFIIPEISKLFPDAKFIFLFRNPVHVMSSIIQTWSDGRLKKLYEYQRDLYYGPVALSNGYNTLQDRSYALRYEDLVKEPGKYIRDICDYLEISFDDNMLEHFVSQKFDGQMGDPTGVKEYTTIVSASISKWKDTFNTSFRQRFIRDYICSLDRQVLDTQGYCKEDILCELSDLKVKHTIAFQDRIDLLYSNLVRVIKPNIWFLKSISIWAKDCYLS